MSRVRRPIFLFITFISPILSLLYLAIPVVFVLAGSGQRNLTILDQSGVPGLYESIKKKIDGQRGGPKYILTQVVVAPDQNIDQFRLKYNSEIEKDSSRAYIVLRPGILDGVSPEYYSSGDCDKNYDGAVHSSCHGRHSSCTKSERHHSYGTHIHSFFYARDYGTTNRNRPPASLANSLVYGTTGGYDSRYYLGCG